MKNAGIEIPGYTLFQKDRKNRVGGVAIYAKTTCLPKPFELKSEWDSGLEVVFIEIQKPKSLVIGAVYRPPKCKADAFHHIGSHLEALTLGKKDVYILGDLNCDMIKPSDGQAHQLNLLY